MSDSIRQSNIFGGDFEWEVVYEAFKEADFTSYDYDSIYQSITGYIKDKYGDDFNDFIKSSELFAHVNLMSYLGQNVAMRVDINASDNFIDKSRRRENILNMAYLLTHQPKRNIPLHGTLKITAISTTEDIRDGNNESIAGQNIIWNQKGVFDWYDRFIRIIRNTLDDNNSFGNPTQRYKSDNIEQHIYYLKQYPTFDKIYNFKSAIEGNELNFNLVPSCLEGNEIVEDAPDSRKTFSIVYKSDGQGNASKDTGFFIQVKQGFLRSQDFYYEYPKYHRREFIDVEDINNSDVWLQEVSDEGDTKEHWVKVSNEDGRNIIYNEQHPSVRNLFFVKSRQNDQIEILFGDSNFSDLPLGNYKLWYRISDNSNYVVPEEYFKDIPVVIPYIGRDGRQHKLTVYLTNYHYFDNAKASPKDSEIQYRAPETRYTQDRMVNLSDYNIYPSTRLPFVRKMEVRNRDNSSISRYQHLESHDPTGAHSHMDVNADDGYIYNNYYETYSKFMFDEGKIDFDSFTQTTIERLINFDTFTNFYFNHAFYFHNKEDSTRFNLEFSSQQMRWMNNDKTQHSQEGYLYSSNPMSTDPMDIIKLKVGVEDGTIENKLVYIRPKTKIRFSTDSGDYYWTTVVNVEEIRGYSLISLSEYVPNNARPDLVVPGMSGTLRPQIRDEIMNLVLRQESFGLRYDFDYDEWVIIPREGIVNSSEIYDVNEPETPNQPDNRWLVKCMFKRDIVTEYYEIIARGEKIIFGSERQIRFYFHASDSILDTKTADVEKDHLSVLSSNSFSNSSIIPDRVLFVSRLTPPIHRF